MEEKEDALQEWQDVLTDIAGQLLKEKQKCAELDVATQERQEEIDKRQRDIDRRERQVCVCVDGCGVRMRVRRAALPALLPSPAQDTPCSVVAY